MISILVGRQIKIKTVYTCAKVLIVLLRLRGKQVECDGVLESVEIYAAHSRFTKKNGGDRTELRCKLRVM